MHTKCSTKPCVCHYIVVVGSGLTIRYRFFFSSTICNRYMIKCRFKMNLTMQFNSIDLTECSQVHITLENVDHPMIEQIICFNKNKSSAPKVVKPHTVLQELGVESRQQQELLQWITSNQRPILGNRVKPGYHGDYSRHIRWIAGPCHVSKHHSALRVQERCSYISFWGAKG